jgi:hypothetical protein
MKFKKLKIFLKYFFLKNSHKSNQKAGECDSRYLIFTHGTKFTILLENYPINEWVELF